MSKYRAIPTEVDGIRFASKKEASRYCELKMLLRSGYITDLKLQPRYPLIVNDVKIGEYRADFCYKDREGKLVIEDTKGFLTPIYKWKRAHFHAQYKPLRIVEL